ncbi:hypothetical protein C0R09_03235 [Brevibacillus laterosporus]|uniref:hypothetical protein n=1 Tax=Brevibacillus laterosporus TaxID=1465 RepID=UPI000C768A66|nr:hypothetical protein [Brevibacillus laterosporus]AUM63620.1 hypothetical protein C0R09_03235 [Brevibacillus laterosporus]
MFYEQRGLIPRFYVKNVEKGFAVPSITKRASGHKDTVLLGNVDMLPKFRGRGLVRQLIIHMQKEVGKA